MTDAGQLAFMNNALVHAGNGNFDTSKLHLATAFTGSPTPTPTDFTEADFNTYAAVTPTWAPRISDSGDTGFTATESFTPTDGLMPNTIIAYYITDSAGTTLLAWEILPAPSRLVDVDSTLNLTINVSVPSGSNWGSSVQG